MLRRIIERNPGPLADEEIARLFRELMSACLALEQPLAIAYLGPEGTYTQAAALKHFGHSVTTQPYVSIAEVFREVEAGECHYGVVPVENSIEGVIHHTLDSFMQSPLKICGEVELRIRHNLLSKCADLQAIERVYAHQQALGQCRHWLDRNLLKADRIAVASAGVSGDDKTTLLFSTSNKPGSLYQVLGAFAEGGVSMSRIESRPSRRGMWDYLFFVDLEGHIEDAKVAEALRRLGERAAMVKLLGSYPRAVL